MDERWMLMVRVRAKDGWQSWAAGAVEGVRALTREQAEQAATTRPTDERQFLLRYTDQTAKFGKEGPSAPTLEMEPGVTIWDRGEPTRCDMLAVLRAAAAAPDPEGVLSPDPNRKPLRVSKVVEIAAERFGDADPHRIEHSFDTLMLSIDGARYDEAPYSLYLVPFEALGLR